MRRLSYLAWFVAPWPAVRLGGGRLGAYLVIALALMALAAAGQRHSFSLNRSSRTVIALVTLLVIGLLVGEIRGGSGLDRLTRVSLYWVGAVAPIIVVNSFPDRRVMIRRLGLWFLGGTIVSLLLATLPGALPVLEAKSGFTSHKNQLAATLVLSLPLVALVNTRNVTWSKLSRVGLGAAILLGLNGSGSRSGLVAVAVIAVLTVVFVEPRRKIWARTVIAAAVVIAVGSLATGSYGGLLDELTNSSTLARATGQTNTTGSDEARTELLNAGLDALDAPTAVLGQGFTLERQPHNIFLGTWVAGGILAFSGLALITMMAVRGFLREARSHRRRDLSTLVFSLAVIGYFVVAFFNVLLWVPYPWAVIALFAASNERWNASTPAVNIPIEEVTATGWDAR